MKSNNLAACKDDLKKLNALPPYDDPGNSSARCGYFWNSIKKKYSEQTIQKAAKELDVN